MQEFLGCLLHSLLFVHALEQSLPYAIHIGRDRFVKNKSTCRRMAASYPVFVEFLVPLGFTGRETVLIAHCNLQAQLLQSASQLSIHHLVRDSFIVHCNAGPSTAMLVPASASASSNLPTLRVWRSMNSMVS